VAREDFASETFRVLKEDQIKKYGEYSTRRLVLEAYDRLATSGPGAVSESQQAGAGGERR